MFKRRKSLRRRLTSCISRLRILKAKVRVLKVDKKRKRI